jgi:hypothetical protein
MKFTYLALGCCFAIPIFLFATNCCRKFKDLRGKPVFKNSESSKKPIESDNVRAPEREEVDDNSSTLKSTPNPEFNKQEFNQESMNKPIDSYLPRKQGDESNEQGDGMKPGHILFASKENLIVQANNETHCLDLGLEEEYGNLLIKREQKNLQSENDQENNHSP